MSSSFHTDLHQPTLWPYDASHQLGAHVFAKKPGVPARQSIRIISTSLIPTVPNTPHYSLPPRTKLRSRAGLTTVKFYATLPGMVKEGKIKYLEDVTEGLENAPLAFVRQLRGEGGC